MLTQLRTNSLTNYLVACLLAVLMTACGGGGSSDGCQNIDPSRSNTLPGCGVTSPTTGNNGGTPTTSGTITLAMTDSGGTPFNTLTPAKGAKLTAILKNAQGVPVSNAVIAFTSTDATAVFSPSSGTALTDANGSASVQVAAGSVAGAFTITATYTTTPAIKTTFSYTVESASSMALAMTDSSGTAFNAVTPSRSANVSATLKNSQNQPISGALVSFSSTDSSAVLSPASALTDANGVARIQLGAGSQAGAFTLNASYGTTSPLRASANYTVSFAGGSSAPTLALSMVDSTGAAFNSITPTRPARLQATLRDNQNQPVSNAVVTFTSTDPSAVFSPAIGTALTDSSGVATVQLASGTQAGAFSASAAATVNGSNLRVTSGYTVAFPVVSFSAMTVNPGSLPAGGNASISIGLISGGAAYTQPVAVSFTSNCVAAGKASIGTPVVTQNGVAIASYTDKGCAATDTITATATLPNATLTATGNITVLAATAGSIKFVSVDHSNIALKGTGGVSRPEYATVKFQLFDTNGSPLSGRSVSFTFSDSGGTTTIGGMALSPTSSVSAADGTVTTVVAGGTQPTSVRVVAKVANSNPLLTTVSSLLVVSSGVPDQAHFSLSTEIGNCEGWNIDQKCSTVNVILGDHFGNPVPDGTAVSFSAEGGNIGASCVTTEGRCSVPLYSSNPRPAGGRVTITAFALGEEDLIDKNGNNVYDAGDDFIDKSPDLYRDDNENGKWDAGEPCIGPNTNKTCTTAGDAVYNGVLRVPQQLTQTLYVWSSLVQQFSSSTANISISPAGNISCSPNSAVDVVVSVSDINGLLMPAGSSIAFTTSLTGAVTYPSLVKVPNVVLGVGQTLTIPSYTVTISCPAADVPGRFIVTVTTPSGATTTASRNID